MFSQFLTVKYSIASNIFFVAIFEFFILPLMGISFVLFESLPFYLSSPLTGFLGGFIKGIKPSKNYFVYWLKSIIPVSVIVILSTLIFDVTLNIGWSFFMPFGILTMFLSGLPFLLIHLVSNVGFSLLLPFARKIVYEKGKFNELELCRSVINRFTGKSGGSGVPAREGAKQ